MSQKVYVGGQAVIEGVMMRGPHEIATAVREPSGNIVVQKEPIRSIGDRYPIMKKPMLRGVVSLVESLVYGLKALSFSAQAAGESEEDKMTDKEMAITMLMSLGMAIVLFIIIPTYAAKFMLSVIADPIALNLAEGVLRLVIFILYIYAISRMKDIQRVFMYHGAEHKTIHAYEAGLDLTVENVRPFTTLHPRCGTAFLLVVMVVSIVMFAFLGWPDLVERILSRVILMPVVAGVAYEIIRYAGRNESSFMRWAIAPGLWLQKLTTKEPTDDQIEVAIRALNEVRPDRENVKEA
ncbi:MAG: DUF1385 domain-containing protein [Selenomonadales bacterium]|nr:DUF1385 domain-containing protein [Selenomonadales bacterium]